LSTGGRSYGSNHWYSVGTSHVPFFFMTSIAFESISDPCSIESTPAFDAA
jgi:hypothetical protein